MTTLTSWNEAYDFGLAQGMTEEEAAAYADAHFTNPDAPAEVLQALTGVVTPEGRT